MTLNLVRDLSAFAAPADKLGVQAIPNLEPTTSAAFGARANRPAYSVLDNANLRSLGLDDLRHWRDALKEYLEDRRRARTRAPWEMFQPVSAWVILSRE